jgi:hypothetical protein
MPGIVADYNKSVEGVFIDAARMVLQHSRSLALLSFVEDPSHRDGHLSYNLPSWVPNFAVGCSRGLSDRGKHPIYNTSSVTTCEPEFSFRDPNIFITTGAHCDVVTEVGGPVSALMAFERGIFDAIDLVCRLDDVYVNGQNRSEVLWRTLVGDSDGEVYPLPPSCQTRFRDFIRIHVMVALKAEGNCNLTLSHTDHPYNNLIQANIGVPSLQELVDLQTDLSALFSASTHLPDAWVDIWESTMYFHRMLSIIGPGRRLFRTQKNFLGLGPLSTSPGDSVYILKGSRIPFILRTVARGNNVKVIGECYLHGFMQGEFLNASGFRWNEVVIE